MEFSVCVTHNSETIGTTDLELQGYIVQDVTCATGYFYPSDFNIDRVMGLDFVKIRKFQFVSYVTLKPMLLQT